jgi:hypothetical protein
MDNIKMDLGEIGWGNKDWIGLAADRDKRKAPVNATMHLRVPKNAGNVLGGCRTGAQLCRVKYKQHVVSSL